MQQLLKFERKLQKIKFISLTNFSTAFTLIFPIYFTFIWINARILKSLLTCSKALETVVLLIAKHFVYDHMITSLQR